MTGETQQSEPQADERAGVLTPLDPRFRRMLRIRAVLRSLILVGLAAAGEAALDVPSYQLIAPAVALALFVIIVLPGRQYASRGYRLDEDGLRTVRGVWNHSDITVPLGRVQHLDVQQRPLERANDLATLVLHTAGTDNASVRLEGMSHERALAMRDEIRGGMRKVMP